MAGRKRHDCAGHEFFDLRAPRDNPYHLIARTAIDCLIKGMVPWGVPVVCVREFLAVATNPKIFKQATPQRMAFEQIDALLVNPGARLLMPTDKHLRVLLHRLTESVQTIGAQFHNA